MRWRRLWSSANPTSKSWPWLAWDEPGGSLRATGSSLSWPTSSRCCASLRIRRWSSSRVGRYRSICMRQAQPCATPLAALWQKARRTARHPLRKAVWPMRPIESAEPALLAGIEGLIFDLDDTLLDHGKLGAESYRALWDLYAAGLILIAATGRPAGWGEVLARTWPVAAVVSENGAIAHSSTPQGLLQVDAATAAVRRE